MTKKKQMNETNEITYYCSFIALQNIALNLIKKIKRKKYVYATEKLVIIKIKINIIWLIFIVKNVMSFLKKI